MREELGLTCALRFLYKFQYHAQFDDDAAEHELCSVFIGRCDETPRVNAEEIHDWRWIAPSVLQAEMDGADREKYTPWFRLEWARVWSDHRATVAALQPRMAARSR